ncbi:ski oncogene [Folsomia candida]|uniref:ski oncogene n=1 Tax=Folsomia candida TaxID=158441 RepID=UPI000B903907|nr:ski oncogene [Folsomia candida]
MDSLCIECVECHGLFSPARFVAHSHHRQEVRTCHWGFDSSKWRHYLLLDRDEDPEKWTKSLAEFKGKFEQKRKESAASSSCEESYGGWNGDEHLVIKRVRYSSGVETPLITSPTNVPTDPAALYLPKKRLSSSYNIQYSDNNNDQNHVNETEAVKKMLLSQLGSDGAEPVIKLLDKLTGKISSLEKICKSQDQQLRRSEPNHHQTGATDLQRKVNTMEAELHSLKKQLLRRHEAR